MSAQANLRPPHLLARAWEAFTRRPGLCIALWLAFFLLSGGGGGGAGGGGDKLALGSMGVMGWMVLAMLVMVVLALALVFMVVSGPIRGGFDLAMLRHLRGDDTVSFGDVFKGFSKLLTLFLTLLLYLLIVSVLMLLLIVPGVIAALGLWPVFVLVMEDDLGPFAAIKAAWALTDGHKMELLFLAFTTAGLNLLGAMACCVGLLVTGPVAQLAWLAAYDEMRRAAGATGADSDAATGDGRTGLALPGGAVIEDDDEPTVD